MKQCPYCSSEIHEAATGCTHCGRDLVTSLAIAAPRRKAGSRRAEFRAMSRVALGLSVLMPGLGQMHKGHVASGIAWLCVVILSYAVHLVPGLILHLACVLRAAQAVPARGSIASGCPRCGRMVRSSNRICPNCQTVLP
jgi:hypothetical protein